MGFLHKRERGAVAVEFAFVFPILLLLVYGVITYSFLFLLTTAVHYAAQVGAEAAVAVAPSADEDEYVADIDTRVRAVVYQNLSWLSPSQLERLTIDPSFPDDDGIADTVLVRLQFNMVGLFPVVDLPLVGAVPRFPDIVVATANANI